MLLYNGSKRSRNRAISVYLFPLLAASLLMATGCVSRTKVEPVQKPVVLGKPVVDFSKGGGGLPIEGFEKLTSNEDLIAGLTKGYSLRIDLPEGNTPVTAVGAYPHLDLLKIDLTDGNIKGKYKPKFDTDHHKIAPAVYVKQFQYVANPLNYQKSQTHWNITATDAKLGLLKDTDGKPSLVLTDVSEGMMDFSVRVDQLKPMLLAAAKTHAKGGFWVNDVTLEMKSKNPHHVEATMHVKGMWLLVPANFKISGKATIDRDCNVTIADVVCEGEDIGGGLLANFVNPAVARYNGRAMPLAVWPGNRIALRDVAVSVGEELRLVAWFEGRGHIAAK